MAPKAGMRAPVTIKQVHLNPATMKPVPPEAAAKGRGIVYPRASSEHPPGEHFKPAITFHTRCDAPSNSTTSTNGEAPLSPVSVQLLLWGSSWNTNAVPAIDDIVGAVTQIVEGPYMLGLGQYGVAPGHLVEVAVVSGFEPTNPFSDSQIDAMLYSLLEQGVNLNQFLNMIVLPANYVSTITNATGEHSYTYWPFPPSPVYWGWVTHNGTIDSITTLFSHELAEACTDPQGGGIQVNPRNQSPWHEICDVCCSTYRLNGVLVASYWSQKDQACFIQLPYTAAPARRHRGWRCR
jgi:hypothetical protein